MCKKILKAGLLGVILGAIAGLFLAPKSGKETREELKHKAEEIKDKAMATAEKVEKKAEETVEEIKSDWNQDKIEQK
jgi:gas vesicle protein